MTERTKPGTGLTVLVLDDEPGIRSLCREVLERQLGCRVEEAPDIASARPILEAGGIGLAIFDVRLPDGSGFDLFRTVREKWPQLPVAIMTGHASVEDAVDAVKNGALDYISKPFDVTRLKEVVELATFKLPAALVEKPDEVFDFHGIIGRSPQIRSVCELIERAAQSPSTVLIQGESGTGKELAAHAIHAAGPNAPEPFVPVDSSSIPAGLLESELFGHLKGSFTGATADKQGLFQSAGRGTVFLDEIGELPAPLQAKLLRALQEREVRPVGANRPSPFKARVIVATNRDLRLAMADGEFRRDLFYRLHVIPIYLPPLRTRRQDIVPLARHFLAQLCRGTSRHVEFTRGALRLLEGRDWPGNVRELQNCVESTFALTAGGLIDEDAFGLAGGVPEPPRNGDTLDDYERQAIQSALLKAGGNRDKAADILHIGVATLFRKLKKYHIK